MAGDHIYNIYIYIYVSTHHIRYSYMKDFKDILSQLRTTQDKKRDDRTHYEEECVSKPPASNLDSAAQKRSRTVACLRTFIVRRDGLEAHNLRLRASVRSCGFLVISSCALGLFESITCDMAEGISTDQG